MPTALTSKSSSGRMSLARSWDGWAAQWMTRSSGVSRKNCDDARAVADVELVMLEALVLALEAIAVRARVAPRPKKSMRMLLSMPCTS